MEVPNSEKCYDACDAFGGFNLELTEKVNIVQRFYMSSACLASVILTAECFDIGI